MATGFIGTAEIETGGGYFLLIGIYLTAHNTGAVGNYSGGENRVNQDGMID